MSVIYRAGYWTDICVLPDGRFAQVTVDGPLVHVFLGTEDHVTMVPGESLMFCRCAFANGEVLSIHQGHDTGNARLVSGHGVVSLGPTFGVQPVAIDGTYVYIVRSGQSYERLRLDNGHAETFPHGVPGSSQGILDVVAGVLVWADLARTVTVSGTTLTLPNVRGAVSVGQADPPQIAGTNNGVAFTAIEGVAYEPHIAQSGDRYAIVARTPNGAAYVDVPPFPPFMSATSPPPIVHLPPPVEPTPMADVTDAELTVLRSMLVVHQHLLVPNQPSLPFLIATAQSLGGIYGLNGKRGNRNDPSRDVLTILKGTTVHLYDVIGDAWDPATGVGQNTLTLPSGQGEVHVNGDGGVWLDPASFPGAPGVPTQPPPAGGAGSPVEAAVRALIDAAVAPLLARLAALEARPTSQPSRPVSLNGLRIAVKSDKGAYLSARHDEADLVRANRPTVEDWERWTLEVLG